MARRRFSLTSRSRPSREEEVFSSTAPLASDEATVAKSSKGASAGAPDKTTKTKKKKSNRRGKKLKMSISFNNLSIKKIRRDDTKTKLSSSCNTPPPPPTRTAATTTVLPHQVTRATTPELLVGGYDTASTVPIILIRGSSSGGGVVDGSSSSSSMVENGRGDGYCCPTGNNNSTSGNSSSSSSNDNSKPTTSSHRVDSNTMVTTNSSLPTSEDSADSSSSSSSGGGGSNLPNEPTQEHDICNSNNNNNNEDNNVHDHDHDEFMTSSSMGRMISHHGNQQQQQQPSSVVFRSGDSGGLSLPDSDNLLPRDPSSSSSSKDSINRDLPVPVQDDSNLTITTIHNLHREHTENMVDNSTNLADTNTATTTVAIEQSAVTAASSSASQEERKAAAQAEDGTHHNDDAPATNNHPRNQHPENLEDSSSNHGAATLTTTTTTVDQSALDAVLSNNTTTSVQGDGTAAAAAAASQNDCDPTTNNHHHGDKTSSTSRAAITAMATTTIDQESAAAAVLSSDASREDTAMEAEAAEVGNAHGKHKKKKKKLRKLVRRSSLAGFIKRANTSTKKQQQQESSSSSSKDKRMRRTQSCEAPRTNTTSLLTPIITTLPQETALAPATSNSPDPKKDNAELANVTTTSVDQGAILNASAAAAAATATTQQVEVEDLEEEDDNFNQSEQQESPAGGGLPFDSKQKIRRIGRRSSLPGFSTLRRSNNNNTNNNDQEEEYDRMGMSSIMGRSLRRTRSDAAPSTRSLLGAAGTAVVDVGVKTGQVVVGAGAKAGQATIGAATAVGKTVIDGGTAAVNIGVKGGQAAVNIGVKGGQVVAGAGAKAGQATIGAATIVGKTVLDGGTAAVNIGVKGGQAVAGAGAKAGQATIGAASVVGKTVIDGGAVVVNIGVKGGQAVAGAGAKAGQATIGAATVVGKTVIDGGTAAVNIGVKGGQAVAGAGAKAGQATIGAASIVGKTVIDGGTAAVNIGVKGGQAVAGAGAKAGQATIGAASMVGKTVIDGGAVVVNIGVKGGQAVAGAGAKAGQATIGAASMVGKTVIDGGAAAVNIGVKGGQAVAGVGAKAGQATIGAASMVGKTVIDGGTAAVTIGMKGGQAVAGAGAKVGQGVVGVGTAVVGASTKAGQAVVGGGGRMVLEGGKKIAKGVKRVGSLRRMAMGLGMSSRRKKSKWEEGIEVIDEILDPSGPAYAHITDEQRTKLASVKKFLLQGPGNGDDLKRQHIPQDLLQIQDDNALFDEDGNPLADAERKNGRRCNANFLLQEYAGISDTGSEDDVSEFDSDEDESEERDQLTLLRSSNHTLSSFDGPLLDDVKEDDEDDVSISLFSHTTAHTARRMFVLDKHYIPVEFTYMDCSEQVELCQMLSWESLMSWDFDIFRLNEITNGHPLLFLSWAIISAPYAQQAMAMDLNLSTEVDDSCGYRFMEEFSIPAHKLCNYMRTIEGDYNDFNPYHNAIHAADVMQTTHTMIQKAQGEDFMQDVSQLKLFAVLLAAAVHDVQHQGKTNAYHVKLRTELAVNYNDNSVLENHHVAQAFARMLNLDLKAADNLFDGRSIRKRRSFMTDENSDNNILCNVTSTQFEDIRKLMIDAVLHTDMTKHFAMVNEVRGMLMEEVEEGKREERSWRILTFMLHMCDISGQAKGSHLFRQWGERCMEEFFLQGDEEKGLGMSISPNCDRETVVIADSQVGFMQFVVEPSYEILGKHVSFVEETVVPIIHDNLEYWCAEQEGISIEELRLRMQAAEEASSVADQVEEVSSMNSNVTAVEAEEPQLSAQASKGEPNKAPFETVSTEVTGEANAKEFLDVEPSVEQEEFVEERLLILADCAELKKQASMFLHPEFPVEFDHTEGNKFLTCNLGMELDEVTEEQHLCKDAVMAELLVKQASLALHLELPEELDTEESDELSYTNKEFDEIVMAQRLYRDAVMAELLFSSTLAGIST